jgi:surfeit locus 1 family protein
VRRRLLGPALITAAMLAILLALGTWQLERRASKREILARIDAAEQAPATPLVGVPPPFAKLTISGRLRGDLTARFGVETREGPRGAVLGAQLLVPLAPAQGPPILVDLGWVPAGVRPALPEGMVTLEGYVRPPARPGWFTPADDPAARQFYTLDPARIGVALGLAEMAPFTLVALGPEAVPDPARHLPRPPNDHLQYALTWYGLAAILIVIFAVYAAGGSRA